MQNSVTSSGITKNMPRWAFGVYELRNKKQANVNVITGLYLQGNLENGSITQWNRSDGKHISDPDLDLVELIRSDKYDKYAR